MTSASSAQTSVPGGGESMPLFYKNPQPLEATRHAQAGLRREGTYNFTREANSAPVNAGEFSLIAKFYPLIFLGDDVPIPAAVMSVAEQNSMLNAKGMWVEDAYIPAYIRRYPFILISDRQEERFYVAIDEAAESFMPKNPERPLYQEGKPTELAETALKFCQSFQADFEYTRKFCEMLKEEGLIVPNGVGLSLEDGRKKSLSGFGVISRDKVKELPESKIAAFHKEGWLPLIYAHLFSLDNWSRLVFYAKRNKVPIKMDE